MKTTMFAACWLVDWLVYCALCKLCEQCPSRFGFEKSRCGER